MHESHAQTRLNDGLCGHRRRPYRSRRNRPCSLCRLRKISCRRESDDDKACIPCRKAEAVCSFSECPPGSSTLSGSHQSNGHGFFDESQLSLADPDQLLIRNTEALNSGNTFMWDSPGGTFDLGLNYTNDEILTNSSGAIVSFADRQPEVTPGFWTNSATEPTNEAQLQTCNGRELEGIHQSLYRGDQAGLLPDRENVNSESWSPGPTIRISGLIHNASPEMVSVSSPSTRSSENSQNTHISMVVDRPGGAYSTVDQRVGFHGTHVGFSSECDPYLLRHILFNGSSEFLFLKHMQRNVILDPRLDFDSPPGSSKSRPASYASESALPTQFFLTSNDLVEEYKKLGPFHSNEKEESAQDHLDNLVSPADGRRLIILFIKYVFPALPVISRSQLWRWISSSALLPFEGNSSFPPYLLAAIYASSLPFRLYDEHLCLSTMWDSFPADTLWQIAYNGISVETQIPRLATVSAALIYLNKPPTGVQIRSTDGPDVWSFMASTVALSTTVGLQLDCSRWNIPSWEKRLRRRLWWVVYSEEKWRCLLMGRPSLIANDQWNVSQLEEKDFELDKPTTIDERPPEIESFLRALEFVQLFSENGLYFRHLATLACIIDQVYTTFYTLKALSSTADDLPRSVEAAKPLRERLSVWYHTLPSKLQMNKKVSETMASGRVSVNSNTCLCFAYMVVEIYIYRALVRPLGNVDLEKQNQREDEQLTNFHGQLEAVLSAAENCASLVISYGEDLTSRDFAGFWYSWTRMGFALVSSFVTLLFVQAPSTEHAVTCKRLVEHWRQTLAHQSRSFPYMVLGMVRMNAMHWSNLKVFKLNKAVDGMPSDSER